MLTKTPNLLELKCHFTICNRQQLVFPEQLETVYISCGQLIHIPVCISASNLKRLTLHLVGLDLEDLSHIGCEFQSLQAFEMEQVIFQQLKWKVSDDEFPQLKVLKLQISFAFKEWTVSDDAFPKLEQLVYVIVENLRRSHLVLEKSLLLIIHGKLPIKLFLELELEMVTQVWRSFTFSEDECSEDEDAWMDV
ncbi:hypothetical protein CQW23_25732 [Capsicum baccatum]|uniref:FBD domain-containing protein n=1 Tax=Capsicum baccatum TaxID=33114 RepID=A0A2G2VLV0_CAPBA|nr:hypothetical protein CQW23_25732 [Capsicum baccatum]